MPYLMLFLLGVLGFSGVPLIGKAVVIAAAALASQSELDIVKVLIVASIAAIIGGALGYALGARWGVSLMLAPGFAEARRRALVERGRSLFARWGKIAVFLTPAWVAGVVHMRFRVFIIFDSVAGVLAVLLTAMPVYGAAGAARGDHPVANLLLVAVGVITLIVLGFRFINRSHAEAMHAPPVHLRMRAGSHADLRGADPHADIRGAGPDADVRGADPDADVRADFDGASGTSTDSNRARGAGADSSDESYSSSATAASSGGATERLAPALRPPGDSPAPPRSRARRPR